MGRLRVPPRAKRGEVIEIRLLLQHPMENGFRRDTLGRSVPRNIIHRLSARYDGREILRAELGTGMAANPYFAFFTRATASGDVVIDWEDDLGVKGRLAAAIEVA
ncbi:MAG: thiosulfate oxidation carrier complex protein SoxZ [Rhodocyclales bacterium]|nr:thiosulfate oxidation carrier complex protein SoxZ [Rhodocyclales bacterium]